MKGEIVMENIDYKALYEEARERAKQVKLTDTKENVAAAEYIFPDLKESEDERIRKWLVAQMQKFHDEANREGRWEDFCMTEKAIFYLEKQKEQKVSHLHPEDYPMAPGECIKSVWSEEDENNLNKLLQWDGIPLGLRRWVSGLPEKVGTRPSWKPTEEQMEALEESLMSVAYTENKTILESLLKQLKKL